MGRKKKEIKLKEPVRIREKNLLDGSISLYLDIYYRGNRKKEGLKLYLVPEINATTKLQNANTRKLAEQIKAQRILDIQKEGLVDWEKVKKSRLTLSAWFGQYVEDNAELSESSKRSKRNVQARVEQYLSHIGKPDLSLKEVDKEFCKGFIAFLKTCTFNDGKHNPFTLLEAKEKPQKLVADREFLTIEEVKSVMSTPCRYKIVKKAFLFSCFTGLRYSDMKALNWSEIHSAADGKTEYIDHVQIKTKDRVTIPLSEEAKKWMPERIEGVDNIFHQLTITHTTVEVVLKEWMEAAGIQKHITYHCSRHTAATMLLTLGASIYVVSKILGHKSIKMTEVYAKIVDKKKLETVNLVNGMFGQTQIAI